jgi:hypothetical protein
VRKILSDERYTGVQLLCKTKRAGVGSKKVIFLPESKWLRFPGTHEAIISAADFETVKELIARTKAEDKEPRTAKEPVRSPYSGKIRCGCCGYALSFARSVNHKYY